MIWLRHARKGNTCAIYNLARCYQNGVIVEKNDIYAIVLFKVAADAKFSKACEKLFTLHKTLQIGMNIIDQTTSYEEALLHVLKVIQ